MFVAVQSLGGGCPPAGMGESSLGGIQQQCLSNPDLVVWEWSLHVPNQNRLEWLTTAATCQSDARCRIRLWGNRRRFA